MASRRSVGGRFQTVVSQSARRWKLVVLLAVLLLGLSAEGLPPGSLDGQVDRLLISERFDFVGWQLRAVLGKMAHGLVEPQRYMDEPARHDFLLDYLRLVEDIHRLEWQIENAFIDPAIENPEAATAEARGRLAELRQAEDVSQSVAEAILEEQVASVLADEGFGRLGQELPPVSGHFTPLPLLAVLSPRDRIERVYSLGLDHGLNAAQQEAIEARVEASPVLPFQVSSLVTGIGGLAAYPAMLLEASSLNSVAEVTAHEWTHHYLTPRPLGWSYDATPDARTINETVASVVGKEIGRRMVARYYPEHLPSEPQAVSEEPREDDPTPEPPTFDFRAEMRETRIKVDELLADGRIEEAEAYMEERRQEFVANGYAVRRLNQAYFAFHGAYADEPGAAGEDPIGPAVRELRALSPDLRTFLGRVARVTTLAEVEALRDEMEDQ